MNMRDYLHQIPTSCLPTLLIFIHIEHICSFSVAFFSATIDDRDLIFGHKLHIGTHIVRSLESKDIDVNEHERLPNITLKTQIRLESKDKDVNKMNCELKLTYDTPALRIYIFILIF
jgi:hypothetical protein